MDLPLVSVIMPSFRSERHIESSIRSVLKQTYQNWELIVADGGSNDRTLDIVRKLVAFDRRIKLISNSRDDGPAHARAIAIRECRGQYVAFLDADDLWQKDKLTQQIKFMLKTGCKFTYTKYQKISDEGDLLSPTLSARKSYSYREAILFRGIGTLTVCISRELLSDNLISINNGNHGEDYLWWCLILKSGITAELVDMPLAFYRKNNDGLSRNVLKHMKYVWISYRDHLNVSLMGRIFCFCVYPLDVILRNYFVNKVS